MRNMVDQMDTFLKNLEKLRELDQQGQGSDPTKFDAIAKSLLWDVKRINPLSIPSEYLELFKIMATSEAAGEYWKGYGAAITDFLLPLIRIGTPTLPIQENKGTKANDQGTGMDNVEINSKNADTGFKMIMD